MMYFDFISAILIFINLMTLIAVVLIGGAFMDAINQAIINLQTQLTALQTRLGNGIIVSQADLTNTANSINQAATTISTLGN